MRGADMVNLGSMLVMVETSPHAWSRHPVGHADKPAIGNISTCVEQTCPVSGPASPRRKHLHMRGADMCSTLALTASKETSPHAWSRRDAFLIDALNHGNISTCVEQTQNPV